VLGQSGIFSTRTRRWPGEGEHLFPRNLTSLSLKNRGVGGPLLGREGGGQSEAALLFQSLTFPKGKKKEAEEHCERGTARLIARKEEKRVRVIPSQSAGVGRASSRGSVVSGTRKKRGYTFFSDRRSKRR